MVTLQRLWRLVPFNLGVGNSDVRLLGIRGTFTVWNKLISVDIGWAL